MLKVKTKVTYETNMELNSGIQIYTSFIHILTDSIATTVIIWIGISLGYESRIAILLRCQTILDVVSSVHGNFYMVKISLRLFTFLSFTSDFYINSVKSMNGDVHVSFLRVEQ